MTAEATYSVEYRLEADDLLRVQGTLASYSGHLSIWYWIIFYVVLLPIIPFIFAIREGMPFAPPLVQGYLLMFVICAMIAGYIWRSHSRQNQEWIQSPDVQKYLLDTTCTIQQQGVRVTTALKEIFLAWPIFEKLAITTDESHLLFWIGQGQAIIIPARAFANKEAMFAFLEFAKDFQNQYVGGRTDCPACNYDLRGDPKAGCPECGWMRTEGKQPR